MRKEVYTKFAEALSAKKAIDRSAVVHTKFAEALSAKKASDRSAVVHMKFAEAIERQTMSKRAAGIGAGAVAFLKNVAKRMSPEIKGAKNWKKLDPRRLFTTTRKVEKPVVNSGDVVHGSPADVGGPHEPYRGGTYGVRPYSELPNRSIVDETHLSPTKILAGLGLTGGTAVGVKHLTEQNAAPAPSGKMDYNALWQKVLSNPKMVAALVGVGLLASGGIGYAIGNASQGRRRRPSEEY